MEYKVIFNGESYDLPNYTVGISDKFEKVKKANDIEVDENKKIKNIYNLLVDILGKSTVEDILGKYNEADINNLNILYFEVIKAYTKPLNDYQTEENEEMLNNIGELKELVEILGKVDLSTVGNKNGVPYKVVK